MSQTKYQAVCSDCNKPFLLDDAEWCNHYYKLGIGTKLCPHCGSCICHGETASEIEQRMIVNITSGKFILADPNVTIRFGWKYQCKTVREVKVNGCL